MNNTTLSTFNSIPPDHPKAIEIKKQILCVMQDVIRAAWNETDLTDPQRAQYIQNMLLYQLTNTFLDHSHSSKANALVSLDLKPLRPVYHIKAGAYGLEVFAKIS